MTIDLVAIVERSAKLRPSTKAKYIRVAEQWIGFAGLDPSTWTPLKAQDFYDWLIKPKREGGAGLKKSSAAGQFRGLQYIARRYAVLHEGHDFAAGIEMARGDQREREEPLSTDAARALLQACAGDDPASIRDRAIVVLGLTTGARRAAITSVKIEGFSLETPKVGIPYQAAAMDMKGGYTYNVPLCRFVIAACSTWRDWLYKAGVKHGPLFRSISLPTLSGDRKIGARLTEDGLYKALAKRAKRAGIGDFHPHILRHTFVTWMREAGVPKEHVAAITSHSTGAGGRETVMERVYFHKEAVAGAAIGSVESVFGFLF